MFGHYFRTLDDKNRIMIPSKLRNLLGKTFYITISMDNVLEIRTEKDFSVWKDKLLAANTLNKNARTFARLLLGNTQEVMPDKQGRMNLPDTFLALSGITKEVAFVGVGNKVELWDKASYEKFQKQYKGEGSLDDLAIKLLKDGVEL